MNPKRYSVIQIVRHIIQLAAFFLFPELFLTVLHALGDVVTALAAGTFSVSDLSSQLITLAVVLLITVVWGRFFCGWLCSFGAVQELLFRAFQKLFRVKPIPARLDRALRFLKYAVLAFIVIALWILALPMDSSFSPWGVFGMLISGNLTVMAAAVHTVGFVLLLALMIASVFVDRFFCRYLCPLGALFTLLSGKRCYKIQRNSFSCTTCGLCERKCSMGVSILKKDAVSSGTCIQCMQCLSVCPGKCLSANPAPAIAGTAAAVTMCGLVQIGTLTVPDVSATLESASLTESSLAESSTGAYTDGVYTGTGSGFRGDTEVQVTVENGYISDITVLSYEDDAEFFQKAQSSILSQILSQQSLDVENVSGATFSANSILEAVADALGMEQQTETAPSLQPDRPQNGAQEDSSGAASEQPSGATLDLSSVADGAYQGEGEGFRGTTSVSVTVESGKITDITVLSYEDDEPFFVRAQESLLPAILDAQSLDVACVSGATFSSNSILEAVANALNVEFENPNADSPRKGGHEKGDFDKRRH